MHIQENPLTTPVLFVDVNIKKQDSTAHDFAAYE